MGSLAVLVALLIAAELVQTLVIRAGARLMKSPRAGWQRAGRGDGAAGHRHRRGAGM